MPQLATNPSGPISPNANATRAPAPRNCAGRKNQIEQKETEATKIRQLEDSCVICSSFPSFASVQIFALNFYNASTALIPTRKRSISHGNGHRNRPRAHRQETTSEKSAADAHRRQVGGQRIRQNLRHARPDQRPGNLSGGRG